MAERAPTPKYMTKPFWEMVIHQAEVLSHFLFVANLALTTDAAKGQLKEDSQSEKWRRALGEPFAISLALAGYKKLWERLLVSAQVDNFLTYLADLLALIFRTRPETMRSTETVRLDVVLQHETMDDLIAELADRRVHRLSYQGMRDMNQYVSDRLGFELFTAEDTLVRAVRLIEIRNLFVHNRGVVSRAFVSRIPDFKAQLGQQIELGFGFAEDEGLFLYESALDIDQRAADKFGLRRQKRESVP